MTATDINQYEEWLVNSKKRSFAIFNADQSSYDASNAESMRLKAKIKMYDDYPSVVKAKPVPLMSNKPSGKELVLRSQKKDDSFVSVFV